MNKQQHVMTALFPDRESAELGYSALSSAATLMGCNIPEERVRQYDRGIRNGGILMLVMPRSNEDAWQIDNLWRINRAQDVYC